MVPLLRGTLSLWLDFHNFCPIIMRYFLPFLKPKCNTNPYIIFINSLVLAILIPTKTLIRHFESYFTNIGLKKCILIFGQYLETPAIVLCVCSLFIGKVDSKSYRVYHKKLLHINPFCFQSFRNYCNYICR